MSVAVRSVTSLVADVGGTNVRFALARPADAQALIAGTQQAFKVADFPTLAAAAHAYLAAHGVQPQSAVIAVAGRVEADRVQMTNHPWSIAAAELRRDLGIEGVHLVNDFGATGMALPLLQEADLEALWSCRTNLPRRAPAPQTFLVLGPGTGLGVGAVAVRGEQVWSLQTEAGHQSFAPGDEEEIAILRELQRRFGRVSNERLLCGSGLQNLHRALCAIDGAPDPGLAPEEITARARDDARCLRAVERFCGMLGAVTGDLVLAYGAWDGVFLTGGLLPPLLPWLRQDGFRRRFADKGRFAAPVSRVPVMVISHPHPGLLGAAGIAVLDAGLPLLRA